MIPLTEKLLENEPMSTHPVATQSPSVEGPVNLPEPQSLTPERLRAWAWHRQGLDGSLAGCTSEQVLARAGWARSVGGANPYLTLFARAGIRREQVDTDVLAHRKRLKDRRHVALQDSANPPRRCSEPPGASCIRLTLTTESS